MQASIATTVKVEDIAHKVETTPQKRGRGQGSRARRSYLTSCTVDDEVFLVGGSAYALEESQTYRVRTSHL